MAALLPRTSSDDLNDAQHNLIEAARELEHLRSHIAAAARHTESDELAHYMRGARRAASIVAALVEQAREDVKAAGRPH